MLKQRVVTALVLFCIFFIDLFFLPPQFFVALFALICAGALWEWSNLSGFTRIGSRATYLAVGAIVTFLFAYFTQWAGNSNLVIPIFTASCVFWAVGLLWIQSYPSSALLWGSKAVRAIIGVVIIVPAFLGCLYLVYQEAGTILILMLVLIVMLADVGAYFAGRKFGKRKLAPAVSPGKSWEGVLGGAIAVALGALVASIIMPIKNVHIFVFVTTMTGLVSVVGDLLESMVKRHRGLKDSGALLPGHGGLFDRIDGLVAAIPFFCLSLMYSTWSIS